MDKLWITGLEDPLEPKYKAQIVPHGLYIIRPSWRGLNLSGIVEVTESALDRRGISISQTRPVNVQYEIPLWGLITPPRITDDLLRRMFL